MVKKLIKKIKGIFKGIFHLFYTFIIADTINGDYVHDKTRDHKVNIFEYRPDLQNYSRYNDSRYNLGDYLGFVVVEWMLKNRNISIDKWVKRRRHLKCVGSNLYGGFQNATVWGSGIPFKPQGYYLKIKALLLHNPLTRLDIRAVRGPLTREFLLKWGQKCPEIYGDPAILMPLIYQTSPEAQRDLLVIPQFVTEKMFREKYPDLEIVSMNTDDYKSVIDAIVSCKKVITSSLHAIILADSYGIPSVLFRGLDKSIDFKYLDYYYSTGRYNVRIADSFEEALEMEPLPLPDLKNLQEGLIKTFPYDLWEN